MEISFNPEALSMDNVSQLKGFHGVTISGLSRMNSKLLDKLKEYQVDYIATGR